MEGISKTRLYSILSNMKQRCYNPKASKYSCYGGNGVTICDEWMDKQNGVQNFIEWSLDNGYNDNLTIDRINPEKGYSADNCRWISFDENRSGASHIRSRVGSSLTMKVKSLLSMSGKKNIELAAYMGMTQQSLQNKLNRGSFSADDLIKIAIFTGSELAFVSGENKIVLDQSDLRVKES